MAKETTDISNQELDELFERYRQAPESYVFVVLADTCRKMGRIEEALDVCDQGVDKHPDYASGHVVRGKCLYDLERHAEARAAFQEVLRLDPNNLVALKFLGMIEAEDGSLDSARTRFERILELDPNNKDIKQALRVVDEKSTESRAENVEELDVESAVVDEPQPIPILKKADPDVETSEELASVTLADIFASQGYAEKALAIYREVLAQQPNNAAVREKIAALTGEDPPPSTIEASPQPEDTMTPPAAPRPESMGAPEASDPPQDSATDEAEAEEDSRDDDDHMVGETIQLSHDGATGTPSAGDPQQDRKGSRQEQRWEPETIVPSSAPAGADEDDLDDEVDQVIMLGSDMDAADDHASPSGAEPSRHEQPSGSSEEKPVRVEPPRHEQPGGSSEEKPVRVEPSRQEQPGDTAKEEPAVVELPYDGGDQAAEAEESQFEEMDESRPIKRQSPVPSRKGTRTRTEDATAQRHRRSIDEKENFNYFKRWLNRMQD